MKGFVHSRPWQPWHTWKGPGSSCLVHLPCCKCIRVAKPITTILNNTDMHKFHWAPPTPFKISYDATRNGRLTNTLRLAQTKDAISTNEVRLLMVDRSTWKGTGMIQRCYKCIDGSHVICHLYFFWYVGSISMLVVIESDVSFLFLLVCYAWFCSYRFNGMSY
jgi:hypothetical protein